MHLIDDGLSTSKCPYRKPKRMPACKTASFVSKGLCSVVHMLADIGAQNSHLVTVAMRQRKIKDNNPL